MGSALYEPQNVFCPDTTSHGLQHRLRRNLALDRMWKTIDDTAEETEAAY